MKESRVRVSAIGSLPQMSEARRERVQVVVRCRPLSDREIADGRQSCVHVDPHRCTVQVRGGRPGEQTTKLFTFDKTYDPSCTQRQLYDDVAHPIVHSVMCGYNGTVLAYGQTASGKTFTMEGLEDPSEMQGIIPNAFDDIFAHIQQSQSSDHFLVRASYLEIYNEEIRDLLAPAGTHSKLELKESADAGVYVKHLTSLTVHSVPDIRRLLMVGKKNRSVGATLMNQDSSRSHSIFSVTVEASARPTSDLDGAMHIRVGKLNLVDLAGSERLNKTGATGERFRELTNINWSLSALGNVISALVDGKSSHIPYRDSKLTRLLQDSLGGNTRTVMIANIGPADYNYEESISTLRYANRAKSIKNKPRINEDPKDAILREFQEEIARLKAQLEATSSVGDEAAAAQALPVDRDSAVSPEVLQQIKDQMRRDIELETCLRQSMSEQAMACIKADLERKMMARIGAIIPACLLNASPSRSIHTCHRCSAAGSCCALSRAAAQPLLEQQGLAQPGKEHTARFSAAAAALQALELSLLCEDDSDFVRQGQEALATACLCFSKASVAAFPGSQVSRVGTREDRRVDPSTAKITEDSVNRDAEGPEQESYLPDTLPQPVSALVGQLLEAMEAHVQRKTENNNMAYAKREPVLETEDTVSLPFSTCNSLLALLSPFQSSTSSLPPFVVAQEPELSGQTSQHFASDKAMHMYAHLYPYAGFFVDGVTDAGIQVETLKSPTSDKESQVDGNQPEYSSSPDACTFSGDDEQFRYSSVISTMDTSCPGAYFQHSNAVQFGNGDPHFSGCFPTQYGAAVSERDVLEMLRDMQCEGNLSGASMPGKFIFDDGDPCLNLDGLPLGNRNMCFRRASRIETMLNVSPLEMRQQLHIHLRM